MKERFEIGLYDVRSSGARVLFFSQGSMMACLWLAGKMAQLRVALHRLQITGTRTSCIFFTIHVCVGTREQDFDGILTRIVATSEQQTWEIWWRLLVGWNCILDDAAVYVVVWNSSTLQPKNMTKLCTVWVEADIVESAGGDSKLLTLDYNVGRNV